MVDGVMVEWLGDSFTAAWTMTEDVDSSAATSDLAIFFKQECYQKVLETLSTETLL